MTQEDLNQLFSSARMEPITSSVEEVTAWVGAAAATSTGVLGVAAKLKLFIVKKSIIMLGSIITVTGVVTLSVMLSGSDSVPHNNTPLTATVEQAEKELHPEEAVVLNDQDDTLRSDVTEVEAPNEPLDIIDIVLNPIEPAPIQPLSPNRRNIIIVHTPINPAGVSPVSPKVCEETNCNDTKCERVKGSGNVTKEERSVGSFERIHVTGCFDVYITQGDNASVTVETDDNLQEYVLTKNHDNTLVLENSCKVSVKNPTKMNIYVTVKNLSHLSSEGVGDVIVQNTIRAKSFSLDANGVGDVSLNLESTEFDLDYNGVGDVILIGKADKMHLDCSGVGNVKGYDFVSKYANIDHSGVGDAYVYVQEDMDLDFSGVGNVRYKGNPGTKSIDKNGIGSVKAK